MAKKQEGKSYVRYDIKYSLSTTKKEYLQAVKDINFSKLEEKNKFKYLLKNSIIRTLINQAVFLIVVGIILTMIWLFEKTSGQPGHLEDFRDTVIKVTSVGLMTLALYSASSEMLKYSRIWKLAQSFDRETKAIKKFPKNMIEIEDDLVSVARLKFKKQKFVVEMVQFKTWKIRGLMPYTKYGLKDFYMLTTTAINFPIYIPDKKHAKKLGDIINGWAK